MLKLLLVTAKIMEFLLKFCRILAGILMHLGNKNNNDLNEFSEYGELKNRHLAH